jgi:serine/threonine protein kinase
VSDSRHCPRCGSALAGSAPLDGLCPACLLEGGLARQVLAAPHLRVRVITVLGEGPSSVAYLAEDPDDPGAPVVLKRMTPGPHVTNLAARLEALRARSLPFVHRHVAKVLDLGAAEDGSLFAIGEFWPGIPITRFIERYGDAGADALWSQARAALDSAHAAGLVHGAVKLTNLLVAQTSGGPLLKVLDFGHEHLLGRSPAHLLDHGSDLRALDALRRTHPRV